MPLEILPPSHFLSVAVGLGVMVPWFSHLVLHGFTYTFRIFSPYISLPHNVKSRTLRLCIKELNKVLQFKINRQNERHVKTFNKNNRAIDTERETKTSRRKMNQCCHHELKYTYKSAIIYSYGVFPLALCKDKDESWIKHYKSMNPCDSTAV
jgi:hypothetical protein